MSRSRILGFLLVASSIAATAFAQSPSPSIRFLDYSSGQPVNRIQEFARLTIEVTDSASAGLGWIPIQVSSDLRGHQQPILGYESPAGSGVFTASITVEASLPSEPVSSTELTVTEDAGPPQRFDTVRVTLSCPLAPCTEAAFPVYASELRILDLSGQPLGLIPIGGPIVIDLADNRYYYPALVVTAQPGGDVETIYPFYVGGYPYAIHSQVTVSTAAGPAVAHDGVLQVDDGGTVTVSHGNYLGLTTTTLTLPLGSLLELLDRWGDPVQHVLVTGPVRVRYTNQAANLDPGTPDALTAHLRTVDINDATRDSEDLQLQETGPATGVFIGQVPSRTYFAAPYNGILESWQTSGQNDRVEVTVGVQQATVPILASVVRVVDAAGADLDQVGQGDLVRLRVESDEYNMSPTLQELLWVWVRSNTTGDQEYPVVLTETGLDTAIFEGSFQTVAGSSPVPSNGSLEVQVGETLVAEHQSLFGFASDTALVVAGTAPPNHPPVAVDETVSTTQNVAVEIPVLANDSDPDGDPLTIVLFTQPTGGGTVTQSGPSTLNYAPPPSTSLVDSFSYRVADSHGAEAVGIVTVRILRPAEAVDDAYTVAEDGTIEFSVTENDLNPDNQSLEIGGFMFPEHGQAILLDPAVGIFRYTPDPNYNGPDTFNYDLQGGSFATLSITVTPVNDPPSAGADAATTPEDSAKSIAVLSNDSDLDGDSLAVTGVTQGAHGTVSFTASGLTYTPALNYNGSDAFSYTVSDGNGGSATGSVSVSVMPVNDAPVAGADAATTPEDTAKAISVLGNDSDVEGDALSVTGVTQGSHGAVSFTASGVTYMPASNYNGSDSFTYTASDGNGGSATGTVAMTVTPVNDPPSAGADAATTPEDTVKAIAVLANDSDVDGDALAVTGVTQGAHGTVSFTASGVTYTPALNYNGSDAFSYTVSDGHGGSAGASVAVTVSAVNDPPVASGDALSTQEDTAQTVAVLGNDTDVDGDSLSVTGVTQGSHGAVSFTASGVTYTPVSNYNGSDSFTYTVSDGHGGSATGTVSVTVTPVNDPPSAVGDAASTPEDTAKAIAVLANDSDPDGDSLSVTGVTQGSHGAVSFTASGVTYTPASNYSGPDSFTYTLSDGNGGSATGTVAMTVTPVNDPPSAGADAATTPEDTAKAIAVLGNDSDPDGDSLAVTGVTQGTRGAVSFTASGVTYMPVSNYSGPDAFTYTISDGNGGSATGTVSVTVTPVNDPPSALPDSGATREGVAMSVSVLGNDSDIDGGPLRVVAVTSPANGTATFTATSVTYTPAANFDGTDSFSYTVSDGAATASALVTVTVAEALERVAVLATHSVHLQLGADVLSGDVVANQAGVAPFLNGVELSVGGSVTTPAGWEVEGNRITIAAGANVAGALFYNTLTNNGTANGPRTTPVALPVFASLPGLLAATPGAADVSVAANGTLTLAPGSYRDLVVGKKGTITFTGGTYHFRSISTDTQAKLLFSAAATVRVQQKVKVKATSTVGPAGGAPIDGSAIVFHVGGINGSGGGLGETPKALEIGIDCVLTANLYAPSGTLSIGDRTVASGAFLGRDVQIGQNVQVNLQSAWSGQ